MVKAHFNLLRLILIHILVHLGSISIIMSSSSYVFAETKDSNKPIKAKSKADTKIKNQQTKSVNKKVSAPEVTVGQAIENAAIEKNKQISKQIDSLADGLDVFLAGERVSKKKNKTSLVLRYIVQKTEYVDLDKQFNVQLQLRLPNTEESWQLIFDNKEEEGFSPLNERGANSVQGGDSYGVGVGYVRKLNKVETLFRPKVKLKDPIETSYNLIFRSKTEKASYALYPELDFFADSVRGTGQIFSFHVSFPLSEKFTLRLINEEQYLDLDNLFSTNHGPMLIYTQSDRISYTAAVTAYSTNDPTFHVESYTLGFGRNHILYKNMLHYRINPRWVFAKANNFQGIAEIAATLDLIF